MSEYEEKLWNYQTAMAMARQMLSQGIITGKEYAKIDATIAKKYGVSSCSILSPCISLYVAIPSNSWRTVFAFWLSVRELHLPKLLCALRLSLWLPDMFFHNSIHT